MLQPLSTPRKLSKLAPIFFLVASSLAPGTTAHAASAYSYWLKLREGILFPNQNVPLPAGALKVTVGGEKEGGGSLLTRVMGPNQQFFQAYVDGLNPDERGAFLEQFLGGMANGRYRAAAVNDDKGKAIASDISMLARLNVEAAALPALEAAFRAWLAKAGDASFSFITPEARARIFRGSLVPGQAIEPMAEQEHVGDQRIFEDWVPLYGEPQRNIQEATTQVSNTGWEIGFKPMAGLIEYERMVKWFRESLADDLGLYPAPGHTRIVFKVGENFDEDGLAEALRAFQAYIVVRGMAGKMMLERSLTEDKAVHPDDVLEELESERGVVRLESERFGKGTLAIEFRVGSNSESMRQQMLPLMISMISTNDFHHLKSIADWTLVDGEELQGLKPQDLVKRFGVTRANADLCLKRLSEARMMYHEDERIIHPNYWVPFWRWENAPFLGPRKKALLQSLTRAFIDSVARWENPQFSDFQDAFQIWARTSRLSSDLLAYLEPPRPKAGLPEVRRILAYPTEAGAVDLGMERTARLPISAQIYRQDVPGAGALPPAWMGTLFDLTPAERRDILHDTAAALAKELGAPQEPELVADSLNAVDTSHGHGISLVYSIRDAKGRRWRIEWDGIARNYDEDGKVIPNSPRGGHVEIVSPKSVPTAEDLLAEDAAFADQDLIPDPEFGGGHANLDQAPFDAEEKARLLKIFHRHRRIITLMFQDIHRQRSAEAVILTPRLLNRLNDFHGTDEELKRLLYDERYFNMRVGRKTRYVQMDVGAYFQDVIPPELISQEYDLSIDPWRPQFRANPDVRKFELRLFNSPRNAIEAALQIRLVRALSNVALNKKIAIGPLEAEPDSDVYASYLADPETADQDFTSLMTELKLDPRDYRSFLIDGLESARVYVDSPLGEAKTATAFTESPVVPAVWGRSVPARPRNQAITSTGRPSALKPPPAAVALAARRAQLNASAAAERPNVTDKITLPTVENGIMVRDWKRECDGKLQAKPVKPKKKPKKVSIRQDRLYLIRPINYYVQVEPLVAIGRSA